MSEENVELARKALDAFHRHDKAAFVALCDPDYEWVPNNYPRAAARFVARLALERPLELVDLRDATIALLALPHAGAAELQVICERWGVDWRPPRRLPPGPSAPRLG